MPLKHPIFKHITRVVDRLGVEAYVVGGYVRDHYLRRPSSDIDVVVVGSGVAVAEELARELNAKVSIFKTYGTAQVKRGDVELEFVGEEENEKGIDKATGRVLVEVSPDFYRPTDVVNLWGDPSKAVKELGWNPAKTSFEELVRIMVEADMAKVAMEKAADHVRTNLAEYLEKGIVK